VHACRADPVLGTITGPVEAVPPGVAPYPPSAYYLKTDPSAPDNLPPGYSYQVGRSSATILACMSLRLPVCLPRTPPLQLVTLVARFDIGGQSC
jgi:hypothetical protein